MPIIKLDLPDRLNRWDNNETNILQPGETDKDDGFATDDVPPSNWLNWMLLKNYQWAQRAAASVIGQWRHLEIDAHGAATAQGIGFRGRESFNWLFLHNGAFTEQHNINNLYVEDGVTPTGIAGVIYPRTLVWDANRWIISDYDVGNTQVSYYDYPGTWLNKDTGKSDLVSAFGLKRDIEDDNFIAAGYDDGDIYFCSSVTGTWSACSSALPASEASQVKGIQYMGNENWICILENGKTFTSIDDCDNWIETTNTPNSEGTLTATYYAGSIDVNVASGRVVAAGRHARIAISPNGGHDWTTPTMHVGGRSLTDADILKVMYVGGDCWVACGKLINPTAPASNYPGLFVSYDDGLNWKLPSWSIYDAYPSVPAVQDITDMACNGRQLIGLCADGNHLVISNALAGIDYDA